MALTITEAHDVNTLLTWVLGIRDSTTAGKPDEELNQAAADAAVRLADHAHKSLMAGLTGENVRDAWQQSQFGPWQDDSLNAIRQSAGAPC